MARRPAPPDPELAALARERLSRVLGDRSAPRRAARLLDAREHEGDEEERPTLGVAPLGPPAIGLDDLEAPRRFTRWHLGVVAGVLLVGLVWGGWSWVQARPEAVAAPPAVETATLPGSSSSPGASGLPPSAASSGPVQSGSGQSGPVQSGLVQSGPVQSGSASSGAGPPGEPSAPGLVVHVLGSVKHPGLVRLGAGARVQDAIKAAGGLRPDADPKELNLAQPLEDGVQVVVGTRKHPAGEVRSAGGSTGGTGSGGSGGTTSSGGAVVDLNQADVELLDTLPGVGPVTAQKILDWREQHGRFTRADELQEVDGIGPKTYARLAPHVRV